MWSRLVTSFYVTPLLHPSTVRQGQWHREPAQQVYLNRVVSRHKKGLKPYDWQVSLPPPGSYLYPNLWQLDQWWQEFLDGDFDAISHDLETAGQFIICDGLTPFHVESGRCGRSLCLRFRGHGGSRWFRTYREHCAAVDWLGRALAHPGVAFVGHNVVGFDIPILLDHGFTIEGPIIDTMVLQSRAYPELQKGLQFCATMFVGAPAWKGMVKEQDEGEGKG